ncbi:Putative tick transposon [Caligus rogercresseyi]|uniref:Tick transposon n=1 Tax=Caligus rogercresseyi TaxID=217165 RepID=A0A7T8JST1_CALRO|nr:Putative tick transposon [Caligus rogercresseyi]
MCRVPKIQCQAIATKDGKTTRFQSRIWPSLSSNRSRFCWTNSGTSFEEI